MPWRKREPQLGAEDLRFVPYSSESFLEERRAGDNGEAPPMGPSPRPCGCERPSFGLPVDTEGASGPEERRTTSKRELEPPLTEVAGE